MEGESIKQEEPEKVHFDSSKPELYFQVGVNLSLPNKDELVTLLREFRDIFAWSVCEAPGVSPNLACHSLAIPSDARPVQQRRRKLALERSEIIMGGQKIIGRRSNSANPIPDLVIKHGCGTKEEWEVESLCGLHRFE